jgi:hypothetical protein
MERSVSLTSKDITILLEGNNFISALLHNIIFGRVPTTNNINYVDLFKNEYKDETTMSFFINIEIIRKNMMLELSSSSSTILSKLNAIEPYIPLIYRLYDSIASQPAVQINQSINYEWESSFSYPNGKMKRSEIIFDIISCLSLKSSLHYRYGMQLLSQSNALDNINNVAKQCNLAASIMKYLATDLIPNWKSLKDDCNKSKSNIYRHPESYECVCRGFMSYFQASTQACCVYKAISKGDTPMNLLAKLCIAVVMHIDKSIKEFSSNEYNHDLLPSDLFNNLKFIKYFYLSLTRYYQSEDYYEKGEIGKSLGCLNDSSNFLNNNNNNNDCIPQLIGSLAGVKDGAELLKKKVLQRFQQFDAENQIVQLQAMVDIKTIDFVQPTTVIQIVDFIRPCLSETNTCINFDKIEKVKNEQKTTIFGTIFGGFTNNNSNNNSKVSSTKVSTDSNLNEARERTDSDIARELQERYDKEL